MGVAMVSTASLVGSAAVLLRNAGIDTPRNDAKLLLAEAFEIAPGDVEKSVLLGENADELMQGSKARSDRDDGRAGEGCLDGRRRLDRFRHMVALRQMREPLQYIVGHAPFRYLDLRVGPGVFIPRPETEEVVQAAIDWIRSWHLDHPRIVDLCAGSGAVGLSMFTEIPNAEVWAVEISEEALKWARCNRDLVLSKKGNFLSCERLRTETGDPLASESASVSLSQPGNENRRQRPLPHVHRYHLVQGDAVDDAVLGELNGTIDAVVTNPPYVPLSHIPSQPEVRNHDPDLALYGGSSDGLHVPRQVVTRSRALLRPGGLLVMEHDISQAQALRSFAIAEGFTDVRTGDDLNGRPRYLSALKGIEFPS